MGSLVGRDVLVAVPPTLVEGVGAGPDAAGTDVAGGVGVSSNEPWPQPGTALNSMTIRAAGINLTRELDAPIVLAPLNIFGRNRNMVLFWHLWLRCSRWSS